MTDISWDRLLRTRGAIAAGIRDGLHPGAQLYASLHGEPVAAAALGEERPGVLLTPDHLMLWLSSTKPVPAIAVAQLWERGLLELDDPVARHLPEFAAHGKEGITLRHLLNQLPLGFPGGSHFGVGNLPLQVDVASGRKWSTTLRTLSVRCAGTLRLWPARFWKPIARDSYEDIPARADRDLGSAGR